MKKENIFNLRVKLRTLSEEEDFEAAARVKKEIQKIEMEIDLIESFSCSSTPDPVSIRQRSLNNWIDNFSLKMNEMKESSAVPKYILSKVLEEGAAKGASFMAMQPSNSVKGLFVDGCH